MKQLTKIEGLLTDHLLYEKDADKQMAWITFNRPEKLNALADITHHDIQELCMDAENDPNIKVVIFKGMGRCFSAGQDVETLGGRHGIKGPKDRPPSQREKFWREQIWGGYGHHGIINWFGLGKKVYIAQVHNYCYGASFQIMNQCDICIATEDSLFTHTGYRYIGPCLNMGYFLLNMRVKKLKEMQLTVRPLTAWEALQCGLINRVVHTQEELEEEVMKVAESIVRLPMDGIYLGKCQFEATLNALGIGANETVSWIHHGENQNMQIQPGEYNILKEVLTKGRTAAIRVQQERWAKLDVPPDGALIGYGKLVK